MSDIFSPKVVDSHKLGTMTIDGRFIWINGPNWTVKAEFLGRWVAVELDQFGGFKRHLYDSRERT